MRAGDQLNVDGEAFGRLSHRKREAGEASEIEPLAETHGVAIVVRIGGPVVAGAMFECRRCRNSGEKYGDILELPQERGANQIAVSTGFLERFKSDFRFGQRHFEIAGEHRAEL